MSTWTRDDLPGFETIFDATFGTTAGTYGQLDAILDAVVAHLSAHYPKRDWSGVDWRAMYEEASRERDEAERERDEAVERAERQWKHWMRRSTAHAERAESLERERDSWRERAEVAEQALRDYISAKAMGPNPYPLNAAPAVTRDDVEQAIRSITCDVMNYDPPARIGSDSSRLNALLADRICGLFGVEADPVLSRAREYAAAVGIDWSCAEPEGVDLLMRVAEHVIGQESDDA